MNDDLNRTALKAGIWYTFSNFLTKGIFVLTTPVFSRIMTKADYGYFSNYASWLSLLAILTTLNLSASIVQAKFDFADDLDGYLSSMQLGGTAITAACYGFVLLFQGFFTKLFQLDMAYVHIMFLYLLVSPAFELLHSRHRQMFKYRAATIIAIVSTVLSVGASVLLTMTMENRLRGRILGQTGTLFLFYFALYIFIICKGKKFSRDYFKYAIAIALPLIPHLLSNNILATTDRIMITHFWGTEATALYSVVYTCSLVINLLSNALNQAWAPLLNQNLHDKNYDNIRNIHKILIVLFCSVCMVLILLGPEVVLVIAGQQYMQSVSIMPPIMMGCVMFFLYTHYVNVEIYHKKTLGISLRTIVAAGFNLIANFLLIPALGYEAAAYTTLGGYIILFAMHYFAGLQLGTRDFYDNRFIIKSALFMMAFSATALFSYSHPWLRFCLLGFIVCSLAAIAIKYRNKISSIVRILK